MSTAPAAMADAPRPDGARPGDLPIRRHDHVPEEEASSECELVRVGPGTDPSIVDRAADLLAAQWPAGGGPERYRERYLVVVAPKDAPHHELGGSVASATTALATLPCSYALVDPSSRLLLAHGRLTECHDDSGAGRAAAATFVVVNPAFRGRGFGRCLMRRLEDEAVRLRYQYLYLWTQTAIGFYEKLGYRSCHRVSLHRDCLKALRPDQVSDLESVLFRRFAASADHKQPETTLLPPDDEGCSGQDVWMRKRLVEALDPIAVSADALREEARRHVRDRGIDRGDVPLSWECILAPLPWHPQVGPSCGLAAVRMVRDTLRVPASDADADTDGPPTSLLQMAQNLGMTVDGELFDAEDLATLARRGCKLDRVHVRSFPTVEEVASMLVAQKGLVIIPYDSHPRTRLPFHNSGRSAHWGVIVGLLLGAPSRGGDSRLDGQPELVTPRRCDSFDPSTVVEAVLLVQHGLSQKLSIAPYEKFRSSNAQLSTVDSRKFHVRNLNLQDRVVVVVVHSDSRLT